MGKKKTLLFLQVGPLGSRLKGVFKPLMTRKCMVRVGKVSNKSNLWTIHINKGLKYVVKLRSLDGKSSALCASSCKIHNTYYMNKTYNYI